MAMFRIPAIVAVTLVGLPAYAAPAASSTRLKAELLSGESATQILTRWCANLHLASPAIIRAERDMLVKDADDETRTQLQADPDETIRYRRVRLMCGDHVLSEADNWYVPSRLSPEMNRTLDTTDTPFGAVVKPLSFRRKTLDALVAPAPDTPLRIRALLLTPQDLPFSLVVESYKDALTEDQ